MGERLPVARWRSIRELEQQQQQQHKQGARTTRKAKAKANSWTWCKRVRLQTQPQPCRIPHRHRARLKLFGGIPTQQKKMEQLGGVTISLLSSKMRQAGAEHLLLDSGTKLLENPGQRRPLPHPVMNTVSGARLQHDGGRLVRFKLPEGRTIRVLFHACDVHEPILSLVCLAQQGY